MTNLTVLARDVTTGDAFDIASHATMTVHRVDPIGTTHVRIVGSIGAIAGLPAELNPDPAVTGSLTVPAMQSLYVTTKGAKA